MQIMQRKKDYWMVLWYFAIMVETERNAMLPKSRERTSEARLSKARQEVLYIQINFSFKALQASLFLLYKLLRTTVLVQICQLHKIHPSA